MNVVEAPTGCRRLYHISMPARRSAPSRSLAAPRQRSGRTLCLPSSKSRVSPQERRKAPTGSQRCACGDILSTSLSADNSAWDRSLPAGGTAVDAKILLPLLEVLLTWGSARAVPKRTQSGWAFVSSPSLGQLETTATGIGLFLADRQSSPVWPLRSGTPIPVWPAEQQDQLQPAGLPSIGRSHEEP